MEDWAAIATEVATALRDVGFTATLARAGEPTGPDYDPTPGERTKHPITVMQDMISLDLIDGSVIRAGDKLLMMAAGGVVPTTADNIALAAPSAVVMPATGLPGLSVVRVEPFAPGGVDLFYEVLLRG